MNKVGNLFIVSAPSGTGKTSLVNALAKTVDGLKISVSYTTRPPRPKDVEGVDYCFVDEASFDQMIEKKEFLEHAQIYGHHYGTPKHWVMEQLDRGIDVLLEIDWQGARQIRTLFPPALSIFILPPSLDILRERLIKRRQDEPEVVNQRLALAKVDLAHFQDFNYLVVNDDFDHAVENLTCIIHAERLQTDVQEQVLSDLLAELLQKQ